MESRVTSSASCSSLQPSVPSGRIGSTRKRVSAVEIPDPDFDVLRQRDAEIGEHAARVLHRARAIGRGLVPDRRQAQHFPGVAGAQRAHDHVVPLRRVLDHDEMVADAADMAERADRLGAVLEQRLLERRIGPGLGDDARAVVRADLGLIGLDDGVERGRLDIAFFGQDRLERAHAQLGLGQLGMVVVVVMMVVVIVVVSHGAKDRRNCPCLSSVRWGATGSHIREAGCSASIAAKRMGRRR